MKRLVIVAAFLVLAMAFTVPASADVVCSYTSGGMPQGEEGMTWCGPNGGGCYNCGDTDSGASCSSQSRCSPPAPPIFQTACATPKLAPSTQVDSQKLKEHASSLKADQIL